MPGVPVKLTARQALHPNYVDAHIPEPIPDHQTLRMIPLDPTPVPDSHAMQMLPIEPAQISDSHTMR